MWEGVVCLGRGRVFASERKYYPKSQYDYNPIFKGLDVMNEDAYKLQLEGLFPNNTNAELHLRPNTCMNL